MPTLASASASTAGTPPWWANLVRGDPLRVLDWFPVVVVAALAVSAPNLREARNPPLAIVLTIALLLPLLFRRRWPVIAFGAIAVVAGVQWLLNVPLSADAALLVAFYAIVRQRSLRISVGAAFVLELGCVIAMIRWSPANSMLLSFILLSGLVAAAGSLAAFARVRASYLRELEDRAERAERDRDQHARLAAVEERTRIAREMHDSVAHHLTVMIALAHGAAAVTAASPDEAAAAMTSVAQTGQQALAETRRLLGVLRTEPESVERESARAPQPNLDALESLIGQVRAAGLPVTYSVTGRPYPLPEGLELTLYRLVQEATTNTLKHAGDGATVTVTLEYGEDDVLLRVTDIGGDHAAGATVPGTGPSRSGSGHGLQGMRERVAVWSGSLSAGPIASAAATGWQVTARIPVAPLGDHLGDHLGAHLQVGA